MPRCELCGENGFLSCFSWLRYYKAGQATGAPGFNFITFMVKLFFCAFLSILWTKKYLFDLMQGDRRLAEGDAAVIRGNFAVQPDS